MGLFSQFYGMLKQTFRGLNCGLLKDQFAWRGEGHQVAEVTRSGGVKQQPAFTFNLTTSPSRGALSRDY